MAGTTVPAGAPRPPSAVPTGKPGELMLAGGQTIKLVEWREGDFYDTVTQASGNVSAGTSLELFRDLANKNTPHANLRTPRRIPAGSEFIMNRIGIVLMQAFSATLVAVGDILQSAYAGSLTFKINDRLVLEGPLYFMQSGFGISGQTTANNTSLATTGVPSAAAAPQLLVAQNLGDADDLQGTIDFKNDSWITGSTVMPTLAGRICVTIDLHGFIKKPQGV